MWRCWMTGHTWHTCSACDSLRASACDDTGLKTACRPGTRGTTYIPKQCSLSEVAILTTSNGLKFAGKELPNNCFLRGVHGWSEKQRSIMETGGYKKISLEQYWEWKIPETWLPGKFGTCPGIWRHFRRILTGCNKFKNIIGTRRRQSRRERRIKIKMIKKK